MGGAMNFAQMLSSGPTIKTEPERWKCRFTKGPSPESIAKQIETKKRIRHDKWRRHFSQFQDMTASTNQIAAITHQSARPILRAMNDLANESPLVVTRAGTIPTSGSGEDQIIWKWIFD